MRTTERIPRGLFATPVTGVHTGRMTIDMDFTVALRGYDPAEVDAVVRRVHEALASDDPAVRASARAELAHTTFRVRLRGYDRRQVDEYLHRMQTQLA